MLNVVTGGKEVGEAMTTDPRVDLVSFTGSDTVGSAIAGQGAATLKRIHLELGGKSALIVRQDANLPGAIAAGMSYLTHCGQGCALTTRLLVHNDIRKAYVEALAVGHKAMKIGDPADPTVFLGPLIRESQRARVEYYVEEGRKSGATLVTGGRRPPEFAKGYFYEPTLFNDVDNKSRLAQEEVFGPVGAVIGFDTDAEAVDLANDSRFGLSGAAILSRTTSDARSPRWPARSAPAGSPSTAAERRRVRRCWRHLAATSDRASDANGAMRASTPSPS